MPRGRGKGKKSGRYVESMQGSDDDDTFDSASVFSSDTVSVKSQGEECDEEVKLNELEESLETYMDALTQKSWRTRVNALDCIAIVLCHRHAPNFLSDRHFTLCEDIGRSLKKGTELERIIACHLAAIISVQLGRESSCEAVCNLLKPILSTIAADDAVEPRVRAKSCWTLAILNFVAQSEMGDMLSLMQQFEGYFSGSYINEDTGTAKKISEEKATFHAAALNAWGLLLTTIQPGTASMMMKTKSLISIKKLVGMLESQHLIVRLTAGDVIVLLYEVAKLNPDDLGEDYDDMVASLKSLSKDSHKYRAKKDRKEQKASFREILLYIEENVMSDLTVRNGRQTLELDSWTKRKHYDTMRKIFGTGFNTQLLVNSFLKDVFEIFEAPLPEGEHPLVLSKKEKTQIKHMYAQADKARCKIKREARDKRVPEF